MYGASARKSVESLRARRVEGDQVVCVRLADAGRHGVHDRPVLRLQRPVPAQHPEDVPLVAVARGDPLAVGVGVRLVKDLRPLAPAEVELVAPGRQDHQEEPPLRRGLHRVVHVVPVGIARVQVRVRRVGQAVCKVQRQPAVGVGHGHPFELRERHRLHGREALPRALGKVVVHLLAVQAVEELPRRVPEVEKGRSVVPGQAAPLYLQRSHVHSPLKSVCFCRR